VAPRGHPRHPEAQRREGLRGRRDDGHLGQRDPHGRPWRHVLREGQGQRATLPQLYLLPSPS
jgi:hypothetical protein